MNTPFGKKKEIKRGKQKTKATYNEGANKTKNSPAKQNKTRNGDTF
jgi:hypothetical protein